DRPPSDHIRRVGLGCGDAAPHIKPPPKVPTAPRVAQSCPRPRSAAGRAVRPLCRRSRDSTNLPSSQRRSLPASACGTTPRRAPLAGVPVGFVAESRRRKAKEAATWRGVARGLLQGGASHAEGMTGRKRGTSIFFLVAAEWRALRSE